MKNGLIELYDPRYDSLPDKRSLRSTRVARNATVILLGLVTNHPRSKYPRGEHERFERILDRKSLSFPFFSFSPLREEGGGAIRLY